MHLLEYVVVVVVAAAMFMNSILKKSFLKEEEIEVTDCKCNLGFQKKMKHEKALTSKVRYLLLCKHVQVHSSLVYVGSTSMLSNQETSFSKLVLRKG